MQEIRRLSLMEKLIGLFMASEVFVDTGGFFSLLCPHDPRHGIAAKYINAVSGNQILVTTDYIFDETITLLKSRRQSHLIQGWLDTVLGADSI